jgi:lipopolysaccharide transport system ATP-binding protein
MSMPIITVENLSKQYIIGERAPYGSLREEIMQMMAKPFKRLTSPSSREDNTIWALNDVSFYVKEGEVLGIIGRNGAGKSTLLKILSRITEPTEGEVRMRGRVASLLEVGTGFHPELTGRENIYLNGALLGMTRQEINRKFDEIVAFSEIEKFLDTPVKRYSSGMYVRLAFAVAAHLEPEILVIDEVLAVGDTQFQKKCLGKMDDVARTGRTVLFVSHNMAAVQNLCGRALLLNTGTLDMSGDVEQVINSYLGYMDFRTNNNLFDMPRKSGHGTKIRISNCSVYNSNGDISTELRFGEPFSVEMKCLAMEDLSAIQLVLGLSSFRQERITTLMSSQISNIKKGNTVEGRVHIPSTYLTPGWYSLTLGVRQPQLGLDHLEFVRKFEILNVGFCKEYLANEIVSYGHIQIPDATWEVNSSGEKVNG